MKIKILLVTVVFLSTLLSLHALTYSTVENDEKSTNILDAKISEEKTRKDLTVNHILFDDVASEQNDNCGEATYEDVNGRITIEAENLVVASTNWNVKTVFANYTGTGYLSWDGSNNLNSPGSGLITTKIKINTPGRYRFQWRSKIGVGSNSTEHNDSWLRFPDADDFYGEKNGNRIYPKGIGKTPNPNGSSSDGWFKVYLSGSTNWTWATSTSDNDAHQIFVEFDTAGVYTMEISGRSQFHLIDRISLSNNASNPLDLTNTETPCANSVLGVNEVATKSRISLYPNPTNQFIYIDNNTSAKEFSSISIVDFRGVEIMTSQINANNNEVDVSRLSAGVYFLLTNAGNYIKFIKR